MTNVEISNGKNGKWKNLTKIGFSYQKMEKYVKCRNLIFDHLLKMLFQIMNNMYAVNGESIETC
jgi:hypothetical protein